MPKDKILAERVGAELERLAIAFTGLWTSHAQGVIGDDDALAAIAELLETMIPGEADSGTDTASPGPASAP